jgi:hypothetical protein
MKLDLYLDGEIPGELDRSVTAEVLPGLTLPLAARSDAALSKLIWAGKGSHKSRSDVRRMAAERNLLGLLEEILGEPDLR